jgi:hypothetical protein
VGEQAQHVGHLGVRGATDTSCCGPGTLLIRSRANDAKAAGRCQDLKMDLPHPGPLPTVGAMKGYGQFCPVAVACEIFAERGGGLWVEGRRELVQALPGWLLLSHYAHVERLAHAG